LSDGLHLDNESGASTNEDSDTSIDINLQGCKDVQNNAQKQTNQAIDTANQDRSAKLDVDLKLENNCGEDRDGSGLTGTTKLDQNRYQEIDHENEGVATTLDVINSDASRDIYLDICNDSDDEINNNRNIDLDIDSQININNATSAVNLVANVSALVLHLTVASAHLVANAIAFLNDGHLGMGGGCAGNMGDGHGRKSEGGEKCLAEHHLDRLSELVGCDEVVVWVDGMEIAEVLLALLAWR